MDAEKEKQVMAEIEGKIKDSCQVSKYSHLCQRISTESGLAWVVNRCINMMSTENIRLSAALAFLENELEGVN